MIRISSVFKKGSIHVQQDKGYVSVGVSSPESLISDVKDFGKQLLFMLTWSIYYYLFIFFLRQTT